MAYVTLKDGKVLSVEPKIRMMDVAKLISPGLQRSALCAKYNGKLVGLTDLVMEDGEIEFFTFESEEGKHIYRHTTAHVLAHAVKRLYPDVKLTIGPAIENGFYYDFDTDIPFDNEILVKIEEEMKKIIKEDLPLTRFSLGREEGIALMKKIGEPYKVELIEDLPEEEELTFYEQGEFLDL